MGYLRQRLTIEVAAEVDVLQQQLEVTCEEIVALRRANTARAGEMEVLKSTHKGEIDKARTKPTLFYNADLR
ncbi:hypothetical protein T484DRAFT_1813747 [Baffinella frigidus]|nr:hypothetical protein T484DRAFT_1813747 [Cryptophyta sp. CCMP2293]